MATTVAATCVRRPCGEAGAAPTSGRTGSPSPKRFGIWWQRPRLLEFEEVDRLWTHYTRVLKGAGYGGPNSNFERLDEDDRTLLRITHGFQELHVDEEEVDLGGVPQLHEYHPIHFALAAATAWDEYERDCDYEEEDCTARAI